MGIRFWCQHNLFPWKQEIIWHWVTARVSQKRVWSAGVKETQQFIRLWVKFWPDKPQGIDNHGRTNLWPEDEHAPEAAHRWQDWNRYPLLPMTNIFRVTKSPTPQVSYSNLLGKSTLCNRIAGLPHDSSLFPVSAAAVSCTQSTKFGNVAFGGNTTFLIVLVNGNFGWQFNRIFCPILL